MYVHVHVHVWSHVHAHAHAHAHATCLHVCSGQGEGEGCEGGCEGEGEGDSDGAGGGKGYSSPTYRWRPSGAATMEAATPFEPSPKLSVHWIAPEPAAEASTAAMMGLSKAGRD
jgi:hypothetical protein